MQKYGACEITDSQNIFIHSLMNGTNMYYKYIKQS